MLKSLRKLINGYREINPIDVGECTKYYKKLYNEDENMAK